MQKVIYLFIFTLVFSGVNAQNFQEGLAFYESKQFRLAKKSFTAIDDESNEYAKAQFYLGRIAFDENEYKEAIAYFEEASESDNSNSEYFTWLGNAYGMRVDEVNKLKQGVIAPRIKSNYEKAVALDPKNLDAQWGLIEYYTQAPSFMGGSFEKALSTSNTIAAFNPKEGFRAKYTIYQRQGENTLALENLEELAALDSTYRFSLGLFYHVVERYESAYELFQRLQIEEPENTAVLYQIGRTSALSGKHLNEGIDALKTYLNTPLIEGTPSYAAAKMRLGMIYEKSGDFEKAQNYYTMSLKDDPDMALAEEGLKRVKN